MKPKEGFYRYNIFVIDGNVQWNEEAPRCKQWCAVRWHLNCGGLWHCWLAYKTGQNMYSVQAIYQSSSSNFIKLLFLHNHSWNLRQRWKNGRFLLWPAGCVLSGGTALCRSPATRSARSLKVQIPLKGLFFFFLYYAHVKCVIWSSSWHKQD